MLFSLAMGVWVWSLVSFAMGLLAWSEANKREKRRERIQGAERDIWVSSVLGWFFFFPLFYSKNWEF